MNKEWSELNKKMQIQLKKESSFKDGINTLITLREKMFYELLRMKDKLSYEDYSAIPFINQDGYHSKTIAYSIWHIFRIEDIVANSLIKKDEQIFFLKNHQSKINSPIITTGNELVKEEIALFSKKVNIDALYDYAINVKESTEKMLGDLCYNDLKTKMGDKDKERLLSLHIVSENKLASWLIDYWCSKDVRGLIQMPFSRHWIMHIEASKRIENRITR